MSALISVDALLERLRNDRFETDANYSDDEKAKRRSWNAAMHHVETVIVPYLQATQKAGE